LPTPRRKFSKVWRGRHRVIPADSPYFERLKAAALAKGAKVLSFGRAAQPPPCGCSMRWPRAGLARRSGGSLVTADLGDIRLCYTVASPGALGDQFAGGDGRRAPVAPICAAGWLGRNGRAGRARRAHGITTKDGGTALLIDESYNANPASMRSTLAVLGATAARRIAVLGAMRELGDFGPALHAELLAPIAEDRFRRAGRPGNGGAGRGLGKSGPPRLQPIPSPCADRRGRDCPLAASALPWRRPPRQGFEFGWSGRAGFQRWPLQRTMNAHALFHRPLAPFAGLPISSATSRRRVPRC
jgi:hypothetical protein